MECVVAKQLVDHILRHGLDNSYQSAYKSGHSTETALLSIKNDIHLSISRGEATALVLLDLSAAFDTTDHSPLLRIGLVLVALLSNGSLLIWQNLISLLKLVLLCRIYKNCCLVNTKA